MYKCPLIYPALIHSHASSFKNKKSCRHVYKHRWNCFVMLRLQHVMFTLLLKNNSGAGGGCCWQPGPRSKSIPTAIPPVIVGTIYINRSPQHTVLTYYLILIEIDDLTYQDGWTWWALQYFKRFHARVSKEKWSVADGKGAWELDVCENNLWANIYW